MRYYTFFKHQPSLLLQEYEALTKQATCKPDVWVNLACTYFFLGMYMQAEQAALKGEMCCSVGKDCLLVWTLKVISRKECTKGCFREKFFGFGVLFGGYLILTFI